MIECIFTIDYEIYGNGQGSLRELVYEPAERLQAIFEKWNKRFVTFVEVAELEMIDAKGTDPAIDLVKHQLRDFYRKGFELGLHLHPQWYKAHYEEGTWLLDYSEYNLCTLPRERIVQIVDRSIAYFREVLGVSDFTPLSYRAGNWLFQPTQIAAKVLAERDIKVDSSVFKGGVQHQHRLDYRRSLKNGYYWPFSDDTNVPDPQGALLELPIYTQMVPSWKMLSSKRVSLVRKGPSTNKENKKNQDFIKKLRRLMDFARIRYPLKFDFCRMAMDELTRMIDTVIQIDQQNPSSFKPIVAIGHTKDLVDLETVESFLSYLNERGIRISTLQMAYNKCLFHG